MARNTVVDDETPDEEELVDAPMDAFDDEFEAAAGSAIDDDDDAVEPGEDVIEGTANDLEALDDDAAAGDTPAEGVDRGDGRDAKGKFATKAEKEAADAKAAKEAGAAKPTDAAVGAAATEQSAAGTAAVEPKWEPLAVRADKATIPIEEVQLTRHNGFHMMAVKDADFPRFLQRVSKGIVGEKLWRDLNTGLKELEAERAAPQAKSDEQIEAEIILATIKDRLPELLEPHEMDNLELKIKLAQRDYKDAYATERKTYFDKKAEDERAAQAPEEDERTQLEGLAREMFAVIDTHADLAGMTDDQKRVAYDELVKVRRAAFWKEGDGKWYANTELIFDRLRAAKAGTGGTASSTSAPSATAGHTAGATTTTAGTAKPDAADRFNKAGDTAARPGTTSLKANRGKPRPRDARHTRGTDESEAKRPVKTAAMLAEDKARAQQRKFMSSDSLDFDDDEDDS